jgi:uncharacterized membrane protein
MEEALKEGLSTLSDVIGIIAVAVIVWGVLVGLVGLIRVEVSHLRARPKRHETLRPVRYALGTHLLLGLEFLIAADIVLTVVEPTLEEIAILASIVAIRTVLSYFLQKEIESGG